jgi:flagellar hook-associated protein 3 FlgL
MRVSFQASFRNALADIERTSIELAARQRQVSSGLRLQVPSDDPTAAVGAVTEHAALAGIDRYRAASDSSESRLSVVDTVLGDIIEKLTQAQATATATLGDTATPAQREAAARELAGIRDALFGDFNTNFRGVSVFAGTNSTTAPYLRNPDQTVGAYQGNSTTNSVDIDRSSTVQVTFDGRSIAQGSDPRDVFTILETLRVDMVAGDTVAIGAGIADLKKVFDRAVTAQTQVGTDEKSLVDQRAKLSDEHLGALARLSKLEDANMAEAISAMNRAETGYRAALGATATITRVSLLDYLK